MNTRTTTLILAALATPVLAVDAGVVSTERFGYSGSVQRFATLADAQAGTNIIDTLTVGDRDLLMSFIKDDTDFADENIALGSWWHTLDTFFSPTEGRAGWGNTRGNTGVGYMQLFDTDASTDTSVSMAFDNFDGTFWTEFDFSVTGGNANSADDFARFSAIDNVNDGGIWHEYDFSFTASGLEGVQVTPFVIESNNQPTGVSGGITGIFEITENQTSPANQGFYVLDLDLTMVNWAWDNRFDLTPNVSSNNGASFFDGSFGDSLFRTVPAPSSAALLGLAGLAASRRRR